MKDDVNVYFPELFLEQETFKTKFVGKIKTHTFCSILFFPPEVLSFMRSRGKLW